MTRRDDEETQRKGFGFLSRFAPSGRGVLMQVPTHVVLHLHSRGVWGTAMGATDRWHCDTL
jgi:hypothetical protein